MCVRWSWHFFDGRWSEYVLLCLKLYSNLDDCYKEGWLDGKGKIAKAYIYSSDALQVERGCLNAILLSEATYRGLQDLD